MNTSTQLSKALAQARDNYVAKRPKSLASFEHATTVLPGGNTRTVLFHEPFPFRVQKGEGAYLTDVDGHRYLNLLGEYTAGLFGHSHPAIRAAIQQALDVGINLGAHNEYEPQLAKLVCDRFPAIERVRFTNSGTEANLMAISTARVATGRERVLVFDGGYHGGLLYFGHGGSPVNAPFDYLVGEYNQTEATRDLIRRHRDEIACILVEPMMGSGGCIAAAPAFLQMLRDESRSGGCVLIFDEVMTSRLAYGGAQSIYGVDPDLTTLGKYVGGGMSFGAFGGSSELLDLFDPRRDNALPHAGTFNNNMLTMVAGCVAMRDLYTAQAAEQLNRTGDELRERLNAASRERGLPLRFTGLGSIMNLHATARQISCPADLADERDDVRELLFLDLLDGGFYVARRGFIALTLVLEPDQLNAFADHYALLLERRGAVIAGAAAA